MRLPILFLACPALLAACASVVPPERLLGASDEQVLQQLGPPESRRPVDGGTRLEYPRGPMGRQTWFIELDGSGKVVRAQQVLAEANFQQIVPGMGEQEVRQRLGRPGEVQALGRDRGVVWSYRYENSSCLWFQIEFAADHTVRSAGSGRSPDCGRRAN